MSKYITVEGLEGVGKSFWLDKIKAITKTKIILDDDIDGEDLKLVKELRANNDHIFFRSDNPMFEYDAFTKLDKSLYDNVVVPSLDSGQTVFQDRGVDTTCLFAAIQLAEIHGRRMLDIFSELLEKHRLIMPLPDKTILLVDSFDSCVERAEKRNGRKYTNDELEFLKKIDSGFKQVADEYPDRFIIIPIDDTTESKLRSIT